MTPAKTSAVFTGIFLILATAMGIVNAAMVGPIVGSETYLGDVAANDGTMLFGVLFNTIMACAVVAIAVAIYPVLTQVSDVLAVGYLAARTVEGLLLLLGGLAWLMLAPLGTSFIEAGSPEASHFQTLGDALVDASLGAFALGAEIVFGASALILNTALYRARLVPSWISVWGFVGGALLLVLGGLHILDLPTVAIEVAFTTPIALNEMVLAVWLIIKGFRETTE